MIEPIKKFSEKYNGVPINSWLHIPEIDLNIYVRRTKHLLNGQIVDTLDIGSAEIDEKERGKGNFTRLLSDVERYAASQSLTIFAECIHNERLLEFFRKRGYSTASNLEKCYFLSPKR